MSRLPNRRFSPAWPMQRSGGWGGVQWNLLSFLEFAKQPANNPLFAAIDDIDDDLSCWMVWPCLIRQPSDDSTLRRQRGSHRWLRLGARNKAVRTREEEAFPGTCSVIARAAVRPRRQTKRIRSGSELLQGIGRCQVCFVFVRGLESGE